jgi:hypothetical protein
LVAKNDLSVSFLPTFHLLAWYIWHICTNNMTEGWMTRNSYRLKMVKWIKNTTLFFIFICQIIFRCSGLKFAFLQFQVHACPRSSFTLNRESDWVI